jgi:hypothetical protein
MVEPRLAAVVAMLLGLCFGTGASCAEETAVPLRVLYLSRTQDDRRTADFQEFLTQHFAACRTVSRDEYRPELTRDIDVVVLDWSQDERRSNQEGSPIGPLEEWRHPLVLLGSAGLLLSKPWQVIGDAG